MYNMSDYSINLHGELGNIAVISLSVLVHLMAFIILVLQVAL